MSKVPDPLWGVDEPEEARRLIKAAYKAIPFWQRVRADMVILFAVSMLAAVVMILFKGGRIPIWIGGFIAGLAFTSGLAVWRKRRIKPTLSSILKSEGRCTHCGYKLNALGAGTCPECGTKCDAAA